MKTCRMCGKKCDKMFCSKSCFKVWGIRLRNGWKVN